MMSEKEYRRFKYKNNVDGFRDRAQEARKAFESRMAANPTWNRLREVRNRLGNYRASIKRHREIIAARQTQIVYWTRIKEELELEYGRWRAHQKHTTTK